MLVGTGCSRLLSRVGRKGDEVKDARKSRDDELRVIATDAETERRELAAAGWSSAEREGQTVWQHPQSGFWYPQGVAIAMIREGANTGDVPKEPEGGTQSAREASPKKRSDRRAYDEPETL